MEVLFCGATVLADEGIFTVDDIDTRGGAADYAYVTEGIYHCAVHAVDIFDEGGVDTGRRCVVDLKQGFVGFPFR